MNKLVITFAIAAACSILAQENAARPALGFRGAGEIKTASGPAQTGWNAAGRAASSWKLESHVFSVRYDAQPYLGNGYIGIRIPAAGHGYVGSMGPTGWPLFTERLTTSLVAGFFGYDAGLEPLADLPNWSYLSFSTPDATYSAATATNTTVDEYVQSLDLHDAVITTSGVWKAPRGERTRFRYRIFADRVRPHIAVVELTLTPSWTGNAIISSKIDGTAARRTHPVASGYDGKARTTYVTVEAWGTALRATEATLVNYSSKVQLESAGAAPADFAQSAGEDLRISVRAGETYRFTKYIAIYTSRDSADPQEEALSAVGAAATLGREALFSEHAEAWHRLWEGEIEIVGDPLLQRIVRANEYALWSSASAQFAYSIAPCGLSSDNYAGWTFWDADMWMFPALLAQHPELARSIVDYRFLTLPGAKSNAAAARESGARYPVLYPWTSARAGLSRECNHGSCDPQAHLQGDIGLAQWQYYLATGDRTWLRDHGWPVLQATAEFWTARATPSAHGGYSVLEVQAPDEYHDHVNNDAFTNAIGARNLRAAAAAAGIADAGDVPTGQWSRIAEALERSLPYDSAHRRYIEFDGDTATKIKQADAVLMIYPAEISMPPEVARNTLSFNAARTDPDGPAMTDSVQAIAAMAANLPSDQADGYFVRSYAPFIREPFAQFSEARGQQAGDNAGSPAFTFLTGSGGFLQAFLYGMTGLRWRADRIHLDPYLPSRLHGVTIHALQWQGRTLDLDVRPSGARLTLKQGAPGLVEWPQGSRLIHAGESMALPVRSGK